MKRLKRGDILPCESGAPSDLHARGDQNKLDPSLCGAGNFPLRSHNGGVMKNSHPAAVARSSRRIHNSCLVLIHVARRLGGALVARREHGGMTGRVRTRTLLGNERDLTDSAHVSRDLSPLLCSYEWDRTMSAILEC